MLNGSRRFRFLVHFVLHQFHCQRVNSWSQWLALACEHLIYIFRMRCNEPRFMVQFGLCRTWFMLFVRGQAWFSLRVVLITVTYPRTIGSEARRPGPGAMRRDASISQVSHSQRFTHPSSLQLTDQPPLTPCSSPPCSSPPEPTSVSPSLRENASQCLNQALSSSFAQATQVGTRQRFKFTNQVYKPSLDLLASSTSFVAARRYGLIFNTLDEVLPLRRPSLCLLTPAPSTMRRS